MSKHIYFLHIFLCSTYLFCFNSVLHFQFYIFQCATLYKNVNFLLRFFRGPITCEKIQDKILFKISCMTCFNICVYFDVYFDIFCVKIFPIL